MRSSAFVLHAAGETPIWQQACSQSHQQRLHTSDGVEWVHEHVSRIAVSLCWTGPSMQLCFRLVVHVMSGCAGSLPDMF
jgi:hypothetical protein